MVFVNRSRRICMSIVGTGRKRGVVERVAVLRRGGRDRDEPLVRRFLDERVEKELRSTLQRRIDACEIAPSRVNDSAPRASGRATRRRSATSPMRARRWAPRRATDPCCGAPPSRGRRTGPAPCARRFRPGRATSRISGSTALGQIRRFSRPVVHLGVDVDRVLAFPGRLHLIVPDALEIRRL